MNDFDMIAGKFLIFAQNRAPHSMRRIALNAQWSLAADDDLPVVELYCGERQIGWLIGVAIDLDTAKVITDRLVIAAGDNVESQWQALKLRCAGSWLFIRRDGDHIELRPDADATVGAVFDPLQKRIASHAFLLIGDDYTDRLNHEERAANGVELDGWFTAGLTAHKGIYRLLPNHRLSSRDFEPTRIPLDLPAYSEEIEQIVEEMAAEVGVVVQALDAQGKTAICLTGGNETRAILAALRNHVQGLEFVTVEYSHGARDAHLASRLAALGGLSHRVIRPVHASADEKEAWLTGAGHAMAGANADYFPTTRALEDHFLIGGLGGEVGRSFLWPTNLKPHEKIDAPYILQRLKSPKTAQNLEAVEAWLARLPACLDAFQILDLAYLELRMGPWAFSQPRMIGTARSIHPLTSYNQFRRMWAISPRLRVQDMMIKKLVEQCWKELLQVPINRWGNWRDAFGRAALAFRRPDKVFNKLRQLGIRP